MLRSRSGADRDQYPAGPAQRSRIRRRLRALPRDAPLETPRAFRALPAGIAFGKVPQRGKDICGLSARDEIPGAFPGLLTRGARSDIPSAIAGCFLLRLRLTCWRV